MRVLALAVEEFRVVGLCCLAARGAHPPAPFLRGKGAIWNEGDHPSPNPSPGGEAASGTGAKAAMSRDWDAEGVRRLREQLGVTQAELADRLGTRQQTVSEWETGAAAPRRMSQRLLRMVAEEAGVYDAEPPLATDAAASEAPVDEARAHEAPVDETGTPPTREAGRSGA